LLQELVHATQKRLWTNEKRKENKRERDQKKKAKVEKEIRRERDNKKKAKEKKKDEKKNHTRLQYNRLKECHHKQ
jgi:hypothetical protein